MELAVATCETDLDGALELGRRALALAETGRAVLVGTALRTEAVVLGALQREATLRDRSPANLAGRVRRRFTTGTEARLSGAVLYHALALPKVTSLYPDATSRTLLNRNLRALLRGYTAAGVPLRYFGTEVLALQGQPVALVGYDQLANGAVLIEVFLGLEAPSVVRSALKREPPAALYAVLRSEPAPLELLERAQAGVVQRLDATLVDATAALTSARPCAPASAPPGGAASQVVVPLGVVEAQRAPRPWLGGDLLCSRAALALVETAAADELARGDDLSERVLEPLAGFALDGARPVDLLTALRSSAGPPTA